MEDIRNTKKNKWIRSFAIAAIVAIVFVTVATVLGELYKPFKNWLKETFYHHWMGKGIIAIVVFYALGFIGRAKSKDTDEALVTILRAVFWITLIGVLAITGFYLYEYFIVH
jgi:hypothetical protein